MQLDEAKEEIAKLERQLKKKNEAADKKEVEMEDLRKKMHGDGERWEELGKQQQELLDKLKAERDEATKHASELQSQALF